VAAVEEAAAATATNSEEACCSWRRQSELFELREREESALAPLAGDAIAKTQKVVQPRHRAVLAEWLAEVIEERLRMRGEREHSSVVLEREKRVNEDAPFGAVFVPRNSFFVLDFDCGTLRDLESILSRGDRGRKEAFWERYGTGRENKFELLIFFSCIFVLMRSLSPEFSLSFSETEFSGVVGLVVRVHHHLPRRRVPRHVHGDRRGARPEQVPGEELEKGERTDSERAVDFSAN